MTKKIGLLIVWMVTAVPALGSADQGGFTNSGGSAGVGTGVSLTSSTTNPSGTITISCPSTGTTGCVGGSFSFFSSDGSTNITAGLTSGGPVESCSGGGRGGHITCYYSLTSNLSGALSVNGASQAINGVTSQSFEYSPVAGSATGTTGYNSAYTPFYYSDSEQILRSDDLQGTNQISFAGLDGGFYGAYGVALDGQGRIYVADTYHCRVVRFDDMQGSNWVSYGGTCGAGQGQFYDPEGIAVDANGKIYVMDTGNSRFVRIDDMTGANWTTYGAVGSGVGQFASFTSVAVDSSNHIYVADTGNLRIVRIDDMTGANWTTLSQSPAVNGVSSSFVSPVAVAFDPAGKIYVADWLSVVRVDDMSGTNWTSFQVNPTGGTGLNSIAVDASGVVLTGGGGVHIIDDMLAVLTSGGAVAPIGTYYVFGVTPAPVSDPRPSAISLSPNSLSFSQNVGTTSAAQSVMVFNFGGSPLNLAGISAPAPFTETNNCPSQLAGGGTCTISVTFTPMVAGSASEQLTVSDDSGNAGVSQTVSLNGSGTVPGAAPSPTSLSFGGQVVGTTSAARTVTLKNTGTGPLQVTSTVAGAPFAATNACAGNIAPGASCTIQVTFAPTTVGTVAGKLTITDNAGVQSISLSGNGIAAVSLSSATLNFGNVKVGTTSSLRSVTLTNNQSVALSFSAIATTGPFAIASNSCGSTIKAKARCTVSLSFSPTVTGAVAGALTFTDSAANSPQMVTLKGTGY